MWLAHGKKAHERQAKIERKMAHLREEVRSMEGRIGNLESGLENNKREWRKEWRNLDKRVKQVEENDKEKD